MYKAITEERAATERAIAGIVGDDDARRLVELGESLRIVEVRPEKPATAIERALALMETREGRATLATRHVGHRVNLDARPHARRAVV